MTSVGKVLEDPDTKLSAEEKRMLDESIAKVKAGDESDFVSLKDLKQELGL